MNCQNAQDTISDFHKCVSQEDLFPGEQKVEDALNHLDSCSNCKTWFNKDMCNYVKEEQDKKSLDEELYTMHGMMHGGKEEDCLVDY